MQKVGLREGPRAPLFCLGAAILLAANVTLHAQTVARSDLERCASLETAELKLACFEALTAIEASGAESAADATQERPPESTATDQSSLATAGATTGVIGSDAGRRSATLPAAEEEDVADVIDNPGQEAPDVVQADVAADLGREQLNNEKVVKKENTVVRATVNEVVSGSYDVLYFHFTNGQVWRQIEPRKFRYPRNGEFEVMIDTGMMGDYRLRLDENSPMTRIKRVR